MATRRGFICSGIYLLLFFAHLSRSEENVSVGKVATQSSTLKTIWNASKAVDGCINRNLAEYDCCSHTRGAGEKEAWWQVDLGSLSTINYVTITHRDDYDSRDRIAGYQLYLSNTTDWTQGVLCYEDRSSSIAQVQTPVTHQCPYVARYVSIYISRMESKRLEWYSIDAHIELCEVQVFGCPVGKYGNDTCNETCSDDCYGGNCNAITGSCFYCTPGMRGQSCDMNCSSDCKDRLCDRYTRYCEEGCILGKRGKRCEHDCSANCQNGECARYTGYCSGCILGKRGNRCEFDCSANCQNGECAQDTGYCSECVPGKYGDRCEQNCSSNCKDGVCFKDTGLCDGCILGKRGNRCEFDCSANCQNGECAQDTGYCSECIVGKYGSTCEHNCPRACKDNVCSINEGHCLHCNTGFFGGTCMFTCPVTCKDFQCDQQTGQCLDCYPGKYGVVCGADCPVTCQGNICNKEDGQCRTIGTDSKLTVIAVMAVVCGIMLVALITLGACLFRKVRNQQESPVNKKEPNDPDPTYTGLSGSQELTPNVYEMADTK